MSAGCPVYPWPSQNKLFTRKSSSPADLKFGDANDANAQMGSWRSSALAAHGRTLGRPSKSKPELEVMSDCGWPWMIWHVLWRGQNPNWKKKRQLPIWCSCCAMCLLFTLVTLLTNPKEKYTLNSWTHSKEIRCSNRSVVFCSWPAGFLATTQNDQSSKANQLTNQLFE